MRAPIVVAPDHVDDVPTDRIHLDSATLRRVGAAAGTAAADAALSAARSAKDGFFGRKVVFRLLLALGIGSGGAAGVVVLSDDQAPQTECDRAMVIYLMHVGSEGEQWAVQLDAAGRHDDAERVRDLTAPTRLPNDLQLCVLLERRQTQDTP